MKIGQTLKVIDKGWIKKPKGFRVHYQRQTDGQLEVGRAHLHGPIIRCSSPCSLPSGDSGWEGARLRVSRPAA